MRGGRIHIPSLETDRTVYRKSDRAVRYAKQTNRVQKGWFNQRPLSSRPLTPVNHGTDKPEKWEAA